MVIDHLAKPYIRRGIVEPWRTDLASAAENPNVFCKLSGMITEADPESWRVSDLVPYVDIALETFGTSRVMFGSDWPVSNLAGTYPEVVGALESALALIWGSPSPIDKAQVFGRNAELFYSLGSTASGPARE
jgi:L-fuconolactonase